MMPISFKMKFDRIFSFHAALIMGQIWRLLLFNKYLLFLFSISPTVAAIALIFMHILIILFVLSVIKMTVLL